jgi:leader peptidase (prepilin peptidase)/N-methyltransferase
VADPDAVLAAISGALISSALVLVASVTDLRSRRIPNTLTGLGAISAVGWLALFDPSALPERVIVLGALILPLGILSLSRPDAFGMGDVKLIAVLTLLFGWPVLPAVLVPALAGAALFGLALAALRHVRPGLVALPLAPFMVLPTLVWSALAVHSWSLH